MFRPLKRRNAKRDSRDADSVVLGLSAFLGESLISGERSLPNRIHIALLRRMSFLHSAPVRKGHLSLRFTLFLSSESSSILLDILSGLQNTENVK